MTSRSIKFASIVAVVMAYSGWTLLALDYEGKPTMQYKVGDTFQVP